MVIEKHGRAGDRFARFIDNLAVKRRGTELVRFGLVDELSEPKQWRQEN